jgi:hypothetical protein
MKSLMPVSFSGFLAVQQTTFRQALLPFWNELPLAPHPFPLGGLVFSKRLTPSMTALQCFEAAARHLSFTRAAQELHLTQSAVSKQVAQLEEMLCHNLFERVRQRLHLSPAWRWCPGTW